MIKEADQFRVADQEHRERTDAKSSLESFAFNMKSAAETIRDKCDEMIGWLDANQLAGKDEFEQKLKEADRLCQVPHF